MDHITSLEAFRYRLPLARALDLGGSKIVRRDGLLIQLTHTNGAIGWGEVAPLPSFSRETLADAATQVARLTGKATKAVRPAEILRCLQNPGETTEKPGSTTLYPSVAFGIEQAALNMTAADRNQSVAALLGAGDRGKLPVNCLLSDLEGNAFIERANELLALGYRTFKLKVGRRTIEEEAAAVRRLMDWFGTSISLRLDANRAWRLSEAIDFARRIDGSAIEYIEEPTRQPWEMREFHRETDLPVALDETIHTVEPAELESLAFAKAVILKPTLLGGFIRAAEFAHTGRSLGMVPIFSSSFESGVGLRGIAELAAGLGYVEAAAGLDTWRWFEADLLDPPLTVQDGCLPPAETPRTGHSIDHTHLSPTPLK